MSTAVTLLNGSSSQTQVRSSLDGDLLRRLDDLYTYYHKQWWCRRQMFYYFKWCHGFLNTLALLVMAAGVVVGAVRENSFVVVGLTAFGTVVKGWNDFKKFSFKVDMCRFAYTTYEKTLIELKTYVRGLPLQEFDGFLRNKERSKRGYSTLGCYHSRFGRRWKSRGFGSCQWCSRLWRQERSKSRHSKEKSTHRCRTTSIQKRSPPR